MDNNLQDTPISEASTAAAAKRPRNWPAFFCLLFGILLLVFDLLMILPIYLPRAFGYQAFFITTGSMDPVIPTGSIAFFKATDPAKLQVGEVIAYTNSDGIVVVHRVKNNEPELGYLFCKGDNNKFIDRDKITYDKVHGIYGGFVPGIGELMYFMHSPVGKILMIIAGVTGGILILISIILRLRRRR